MKWVWGLKEVSKHLLTLNNVLGALTPCRMHLMSHYYLSNPFTTKNYHDSSISFGAVILAL